MDDLILAGRGPRPLFDTRDRDHFKCLMTAIDAVNAKFGCGAIAPAAAGIRRDWQTKFDMRSPRYTTRVAELPRIAAR